MKLPRYQDFVIDQTKCNESRRKSQSSFDTEWKKKRNLWDVRNDKVKHLTHKMIQREADMQRKAKIICAPILQKFSQGATYWEVSNNFWVKSWKMSPPPQEPKWYLQGGHRAKCFICALILLKFSQLDSGNSGGPFLLRRWKCFLKSIQFVRWYLEKKWEKYVCNRKKKNEKKKRFTIFSKPI